MYLSTKFVPRAHFVHPSDVSPPLQKLLNTRNVMRIQCYVYVNRSHVLAPVELQRAGCWVRASKVSRSNDCQGPADSYRLRALVRQLTRL
jgi:hypothetical protein